MALSAIDWICIVAYLVFLIGIGFWYRKDAGAGLENYFLGGRKLPWYLAGLSMVATTFAADTPLLVTELVHQSGVSGNWLWWNMLIGGMLTTFFFARLWRRSGVLTEIEFIALRYSGAKARFLRIFKALYLGVFMNAIIMGWVNLALLSIVEVFFDVPVQFHYLIVIAAMFFATVYSAMSGLKGIVVADAVQFIIAMSGSVLLAVFVIRSEQVDGVSGLLEQLPSHGGYTRFFPVIGQNSNIAGMLTIGLSSFLAFVTLQWWASWYPGAEPGGGGYVAQRMMSTRSEKDSVWATLFFQVSHYALRPWPWILVALSTLVLFPELDASTARQGYVMAIRDFMPVGLKGVMLVALFAAYMSTISTQLNWGASFVVNDVVRPLRNTGHSLNEKKLVAYSRLATYVLMVLSLVPTLLSDTITGLWEFLIACGAGLGLVLILRWYWWRVNAWSEITATFLPVMLLPVSTRLLHLDFPNSLFFIVGFTTLGWILVTLVTKPEKMEHLENFYQKVHPSGVWKLEGIKRKDYPLRPWLFVSWGSSVLFVYGLLFSLGYLLFRDWQPGFIWLTVSVLALGVLVLSMRKSN